MDGDSEKAIAVKLDHMGYIPISIHPDKGESKINKILSRFEVVRFSDLNMFTRQFYTLQKAGLPLLASLNALREQSTNRILKNVIEQLRRDVEAGTNLSGALERHPAIFNTLYVNMIKSGEVSGRLAEILERLATLGEHEEKIRLKINAAMRYPLMVVVTLTIGFLILITFVIPRFTEIYNKFTTALPLPTQILIGVHYTMVHFWWLIILTIVAVISLLKFIIRTPAGRFWWDGLKLKVPVLGPLFLKLTMSRFSRITATLMMSGISILEILDLVGDGVGNGVIRRTILDVKNSVNEGKGMSEPMKMSGMFPPVVVQMVAVGEETGKLDELLLHISDYYDSQIDYTVQNLISLIEPMLIFVLAIAVLIMALGIFMPMWNMMQLFKK